MFYTIRIKTDHGRRIERHVRAPLGLSKSLGDLLGRLYGSKDISVTPITDPKILAKLVARISILSLLIVAQISAQMMPDDFQDTRTARSTRVIRTSRTRRESHV